jgi:hypothetical protein
VIRPTAIFLALFSVACDDDELVWVPFNAEGERLKVGVGEEVIPCPAEGEPALEGELICRIDLYSNLGVTLVGEAMVDPASGPVGTEHFVTVIVFDDFETLVGRATVIVDSEAISDLDGDGEPDSRGEGEFEMRRDSADIGAYALTLQSMGSEGESRLDTFTIQLYQPEELATELTE